MSELTGRRWVAQILALIPVNQVPGTVPGKPLSLLIKRDQWSVATAAATLNENFTLPRSP